LSVIELKDVSLVRDDKFLLKDLNWRVQNGEHWAVIGKNGSGKTLTLSMICGYLWPSSGQVEVLDKTFGNVDLRQLRKKIGWVTSSLEYKLQEKSIKTEDIVFSGIFASIGLYDKITSKDKDFAYEQMKFMSCFELRNRDFSTLSTGEKKRVIIARALSAKPELLILDEPANGLDIAAREDFLNSLEKLSKTGTSVIFVSHHIEEILGFISHCILLKDGKVLEKGKKDSILNNKSLSKCLDINLEIEKNGLRYVSRVQN